MSETTERVVAQRELARAQERLTQALSASGMVGTFDWQVQTDTFYSDARFVQMFSVDPAKGEKGAPLVEYLAGIHPEDVEQITEAVNPALATGQKYIHEYRVLQKDGTNRWVEARGECLYDENGKPSRLVGVVVDITNQKEAQERQRLLAREANHRVKNLFAVFHGIISLSARSARTPQEMAQSLRGRLDALMRAKDLCFGRACAGDISNGPSSPNSRHVNERWISSMWAKSRRTPRGERARFRVAPAGTLRLDTLSCGENRR